MAVIHSRVIGMPARFIEAQQLPVPWRWARTNNGGINEARFWLIAAQVVDRQAITRLPYGRGTGDFHEQGRHVHRVSRLSVCVQLTVS